MAEHLLAPSTTAASIALREPTGREVDAAEDAFRVRRRATKGGRDAVDLVICRRARGRRCYAQGR